MVTNVQSTPTTATTTTTITTTYTVQFNGLTKFVLTDFHEGLTRAKNSNKVLEETKAIDKLAVCKVKDAMMSGLRS